MTLLSVQGLQLSRGERIFYQHLDWTIQPGERWAILGPNGSGKTTLLHALAGLLPQRHGTICLGENTLHQLTAKKIAQQLGVLFQENTVTFSQTVFDYCLAGRYPHRGYFAKEKCADRDIVLSALQTMSVDHLQTRCITELSGGEKRRVAIATLLAQQPAIYLLDEPTNHLDVRHQMQVLNELMCLAQNKKASIVMTLHDINLAQQYCNHFLLLLNDAPQQGTHDILTVENLSRLYEHPIVKQEKNGRIFWYPEQSMYRHRRQP